MVLAMSRGENLEPNPNRNFEPGVVMMKQYTAFPTTLEAISASVIYYT